MIENERQYQVTRELLERLERALAQLEARPPPANIHSLREAEIDGLRSQIAALRGQLAEYEAARQ
jgi:polyhydroxyalkanoate synthesis regulator phasin